MRLPTTLGCFLALILACATPPQSGASAPTSGGETPPSTSIVEEPLPPNGGTSETTIEFNSLACNLSTLLGDLQGATIGSVETVDKGLSGLPWDAPEREYALVRIAVETVAGQAASAVTGHSLPGIEGGKTVDVVLYPDLNMTPLEPLVDLAATGKTAFFAFSGAGDMNDIDSTGSWFLRRMAVTSHASVLFTGFCSQILDQQFGDFAKALGQPASPNLLVELAAEVISHAPDADLGPLEKALNETLYDSTS